MRIAGRQFVRRAARFDTVEQTVSLDLAALGMGVVQTEDFIVYRTGEEVRIYDRVCDHNGGRLITNGGAVSCPLHGWRFDPRSGAYENAAARKKPVFQAFADNMPAVVELARKSSRRGLQGYGERRGTSLRFLNHACVVVETGGIRFATDPWIFGPAFCNGWWLAWPSPQDSMQVLNNCDFIYISHNHPDHLHPETLSDVRRDMPILTPDFATGSTLRYLRDLGFGEIHSMGFDEVWADEAGQIALSCLKSGDFRDDSGLLLESGEFTALFGVDSNYIDFWRFPERLTVLANSFAGGASGFPLCFENYTEAEKRRIVTRNRNAVRATNRMMLEIARPDFFLPYAGFFKERAERDAFIAERNNKNAIADFAENCAGVDCEILDVTKAQIFRFDGDRLVSSLADQADSLPVDDIAQYLKDSLQSYGNVDENLIRDYFLRSKFQRDLDFELIVTTDDFSRPLASFNIHFREGDDPLILTAGDGIAPRRHDVRYKQIRVRAAELMKVIRQGLPWEDLSIGFQCRVYREPNVYNADFWYHFSNVYVNDAVKTRTQDCAGCAILEQRVF